MKTPLKFSLLLSLAAALMSAVPSVQAGTAGINDQAGFFSEAAKSDAGWNIRELQKSLKKDVCIETFAEIPANLRQGINLQDKAAANRLFDSWAVQRARDQSVDGVYILIVRQPAHLQAVVGNETQKKAFTLADRNALADTMLAKLRAKDYDTALRDGVTFIVSTMKNHAGAATAPPAPVPVQQQQNQPAPVAHRESTSSSSSSPFGWLLPLIVLGVLAWLAFALFRALFRGGRSNTIPTGQDAPMGAPGGGGGFGRSFLGGLFGGAAGMWLYDNFFGSHGSSAYGAPPSQGNDPFNSANDPGHDVSGSSGNSPFGAPDTDYSSSGGDFDGGGSFDSGSDFGGGGGDSGGGGGDF